MTDLSRRLTASARQWIEQEQVWNDSLYASAAPQTPGLAPAVPRPAGPPAVVQAPGAPSSAKAAALAALYEKYKDCTRCRLGPTRIQFVFGMGSPESKVLLIGEGPGYEEDRRGEPFVGKSGQLLDKILASIGLSRQANAYIANIVKCHPMINPQTPEARGNDRAPSPDEVETCSPILLQQIAILQPRIIMTLGSPSTRMVLKTKDGITQLRGKFFPFAVDAFYPEEPGQAANFFGTPAAPAGNPLAISLEARSALRQTRVLPTYHPAALLRNPHLKSDTWTDMKLLRDALAAL